MSKSGYAFWQLKRYTSGKNGAKHLSHVLREKTEREDIGDKVYFDFFANIKHRIEGNRKDLISLENIKDIESFYNEKREEFGEILFNSIDGNNSRKSKDWDLFNLRDLDGSKTVGYIGLGFDRFYHEFVDLYGYKRGKGASHYIDIMFSFPSQYFVNYLHKGNYLDSDDVSDEDMDSYRDFVMENNFSLLSIGLKRICMPVISDWFYKVVEEMYLKVLFSEQAIFEQYSFCCLHLDEAQPHIHLIMPSVCIDGRRFQLYTVPLFVNQVYKKFLEDNGWMVSKEIDKSLVRRSLSLREYRLAEKTFLLTKPEITKSLDLEMRVSNLVKSKLYDFIMSDILNIKKDLEELNVSDSEKELQEILDKLFNIKLSVQWNMVSLLKHKYPLIFRSLLLGEKQGDITELLGIKGRDMGTGF